MDIKIKHTLADYIFGTGLCAQSNWFTDEMALKVEKFIDDSAKGLSPRLIITMPPRHGKTTFASKILPYYSLLKYPKMRLVGSFATKHLADMIAISSSKALGVSHTYPVFGVNQEVTAHADIGIIDDLIKDAKEAASKVYRDSVWDWYLNEFEPSINDGGGIIVFASRWHEDDLVGRLINSDSSKWQLINYEAIATSDSKDRRYGEALSPNRYSSRQLMNIKKALGDSIFSTLFQGQPIADV